MRRGRPLRRLGSRKVDGATPKRKDDRRTSGRSGLQRVSGRICRGCPHLTAAAGARQEHNGNLRPPAASSKRPGRRARIASHRSPNVVPSNLSGGRKLSMRPNDRFLSRRLFGAGLLATGTGLSASPALVQTLAQTDPPLTPESPVGPFYPLTHPADHDADLV